MLPVVQIAQHPLESLPARQAGGKLAPLQLEFRRQSDQRRVIAGGPLLHPFVQQVLHGSGLALITGTFSRRGRHGGMRMGPQWEVLGDPQHFPGFDKPLVQHWLRGEGMALAGRALKVPDSTRTSSVLGLPL